MTAPPLSPPRPADDSVSIRGAIVLADSVLDDGVVVTAADRIHWVGPTAECDPRLRPPAPTARWVVPGLIDVHNHGGAGSGFPEPDPAGHQPAIDYHRHLGTTTQLASLVSAPVDVLLKRIEALAPLVEAGDLAGLHLEGPFLATSRCGAHDPNALIAGDSRLVDQIAEAGHGTIRSMTLAPEIPGFADVVTALRRHQILPSIGHTDASSAATRAAIASAGPGGLSATHLFNAMSPWDHRNPGAAAACLTAAARGDLVVELIADGVHLADETVRMVYDLIGADHIALVSDAMAAAGMPPGRYQLGSMEVQVDHGTARVVDSQAAATGAIAGGTSSLIDIVGRTIRTGVPLPDAVRSASLVPATLLGIHQDVGQIAPGLRADLLTLDEHLRPVDVMRNGRWLSVPTSSRDEL